MNRSRGRTNNRSPRAVAVCDRCGGLVNHVNLRSQHEWNGSQLQDLRILVCSKCYDIPNEQLRSLMIPADPVPVNNPRPQIPPDGGPNTPIPELILAQRPDTLLVTDNGDYLVTF